MTKKTKAISAIIFVIIVVGGLVLASGLLSSKAPSAETNAKINYFLGKAALHHKNESAVLKTNKQTYLKIAERLQKLTPMQKAGSVMMIAIPDQYLSANTKNFINKYQIGGVILMGGNLGSASQTEELISSIRKSADHGMLFAVDQEGAPVARVSWEKHAKISAPSLGKTYDLSEIYSVNYERAVELKELGFDINFAPVGDLNYPGSWISNRAFGTDPNAVSEIIKKISQAQHDGGIATTVKHYPGLGRSPKDSHLELPLISASEQELNDSDLKPFLSAIKAGAELIMVSHGLFPAIDPDNPASISAKVLQNLLREEQGFEGLVVTDDMKMDALRQIPQKFSKTVKAGSDIVLLIDSYPNTEKAVADIATNVDAKTLDAHLYRIYKQFPSLVADK